MSDYSNDFQIRYLLSKFEEVQKNISKQSRIFKSLVDLEEIDLAINTFKNQKF